jgi:hypothetical protein
VCGPTKIATTAASERGKLVIEEEVIQAAGRVENVRDIGELFFEDFITLFLCNIHFRCFFGDFRILDHISITFFEP